MRLLLKFIVFFLFVLVTTGYCLAQQERSFGDYQVAVDKAVLLLEKMHQKEKKFLVDDFTETAFQSSKDFKSKLKGNNLSWVSSLVEEYGVPDTDNIAISAWTVGNKTGGVVKPSVNISFYFKADSAMHNPTDNRVSINLTFADGEYHVDGLLFFKKEDYEKMKEIISDMP